MTYKILCKQVELADSSKEKIIAKLKKLDKFFGGDDECKIQVSEQREQMVVEITFVYKDRQIRKNKTKLAKRLRDDTLENYNVDFEGSVDDEKEEFKIIKVKKVEAKPMMPEEAILQMNMLGHDFFIFTDPHTAKTNLVYKRKDGNYALIETN